MCVCVVLELYSLIAGLLHRDPTERTTLEELLQDPWIRQPINLAEYSWSEVFPCNHGTHTYTLSFSVLCFRVGPCAFILATNGKKSLSSSGHFASMTTIP